MKSGNTRKSLITTKALSPLLGHSFCSLSFAFLAAFFFAGCPNPLSSPTSATTESNVLIVQIEDDSPSSDLPEIFRYYISVIRSGSPLGSLTNAQANAGSYHVVLTAVPEAGDKVLVEGYDTSGVKNSSGSYTLPDEYAAGDAVSITLQPSSPGNGNVDLEVRVFSLGSGDDELTAVERILYRSLEDYETGNVYDFKRYRKSTPSGDYGEGEDLTTTIPIGLTGVPLGNYVARIDFFRAKYVRVFRLVQTIVVRDGFTTRAWNEQSTGYPLNLTADNFPSSNAALNGIKIGEAALPVYNSSTSTYNIEEPVTAAPPGKTLSLAAAVAGQVITASLNGTDVPLERRGLVFTSKDPMPIKGVNYLVVIVGAPDGVTKRTYAVSYTCRYSTQWYVSASGDDNNAGTSPGAALLSVEKAIEKISAAYDGGSLWPGTSDNPVPARLNMSGTFTATVHIKDAPLYASLPPIILGGSGALRGTPSLAIKNAAVILGDGLTLTGVDAGVSVESGGSFTMNGGTISGNSAGGVHVASGGGFIMNAGAISENSAEGSGGGVLVENNSGSFIMNGGAISGNSAESGGGVGVASGGRFIMYGGSITANTARGSGGGVYVVNDGRFTLHGGSLDGNSATENSGGGVYVSSSGRFTMNGGSLSGNASRGSSAGGGGVFVGSGGSFSLNGGSLSGNSAQYEGGGVFAAGSFIMNDGIISGNASQWSGGGVMVGSSAVFTMNGGTISGNNSISGPNRGVHLENGGAFNKTGVSVADVVSR
jgi:hypothetical protein